MPVASLLGQSQAVELLSQAIARNRLAPAYLFAGSPGIGKRLAAESFVESLFCDFFEISAEADCQHRVAQRNHPDLLWVEPTFLHQGKRLSPAEAEAAGVKKRNPPQVRLDQVREITRFLGRPPMEAGRSLVIIDHADTMAEAAANALLKTLEEPGQATLILLAPSSDSLLPTLVSRCQKIPFYRLDQETMAQVLQKTGHAEILQHPQVLALAQGSPGAAIAHWQQLQIIPPEILQAVTQMPRSLQGALTIAQQISKTLDSESQLWLIDYLQSLHWQHSLSVMPLQLLEKAKNYLLANVQPRLVWEVTLMGMI